MNKKELAIIAVLGLMGIIQVSFAPYLILPWEWLSWVNLVDTAVVLIALFERRRNRLSWAAALWGGIFLDMYSIRFFGFWTLILIVVVAFIKVILKKYVQLPSFW